MEKELERCASCHFFARLYHWNYSSGKKLLGYVCTMLWELERSVVNSCESNSFQCEMWAPRENKEEILNNV